MWIDYWCGPLLLLCGVTVSVALPFAVWSECWCNSPFAAVGWLWVQPLFLLWDVCSVQTVISSLELLAFLKLPCVRVFVHRNSVWGFECLTYYLCEGLTVASFCGPIPLVARKFLHLLARDPTYMVDLWAGLCLSIITIGSASLVVAVTSSEVSLQGKVNLSIQAYHFQIWIVFWVFVQRYLDLCISSECDQIWTVCWVFGSYSLFLKFGLLLMIRLSFLLV